MLDIPIICPLILIILSSFNTDSNKNNWSNALGLKGNNYNVLLTTIKLFLPVV